MPTTTRSAFDANGRIFPLIEGDERRRTDEAIRALDELARIGDDDEQRETFAALAEAIDQDRISDRKRFGE